MKINWTVHKVFCFVDSLSPLITTMDCSIFEFRQVHCYKKVDPDGTAHCVLSNLTLQCLQRLTLLYVVLKGSTNFRRKRHLCTNIVEFITIVFYILQMKMNYSFNYEASVIVESFLTSYWCKVKEKNQALTMFKFHIFKTRTQKHWHRYVCEIFWLHLKVSISLNCAHFLEKYCSVNSCNYLLLIFQKYRNHEYEINLLNWSCMKLNLLIFYIYPKYWDKEALEGSVDTYQMLHGAASDQNLHCLPHI